MKYLMRTLLFAALALLVIQVAAAQDVPFVSKTETIQGTIAMVQAENNLVIVKTEDGTFFDFKVGPAAKIEIGGIKATLSNLADQVGKTVSVTFRTLRTGDSALKVEVQ